MDTVQPLCGQDKKMEAKIAAYEKFTDSARKAITMELKVHAMEGSIAKFRLDVIKIHNRIISGK